MRNIELFQQKMVEKKYDAYIVPTSDYHNSEYICDFFKCREFLSNFTGSQGTLVVLQNNAYLWADGRYYIQAAKQIEGTGISLMKMGQPNVPTIEDFLAENLKTGDTLAFDGRVMNTSFVNSIKAKINSKINIVYNTDLVGEIWKNRPSLPYSLIYKLEDFYTGKNFQSKLADVREKMKDYDADIHIITSLEDQAWLFNLRANDILHTPVFLAYTIITQTTVTLFVDFKKLDIEVSNYLDNNDVIVRQYNDLNEVLRGIKSRRILIDLAKANYSITALLESQGNTLLNHKDPTLFMKSIKNETEIKNIKIAHIRDGVAVTKFMCYVKKAYEAGEDISEISISDFLAKQRAEQKGFIDLSFNTICAFGPHGAMMHYSANSETNAPIKGNGFLLVDSGGHYLEGTTDITRTMAIGKTSDIMRTHYTTVLKSVIALSQAIFLKGCNGNNLDILARGPIWKLLIDYKCGTGHGVGNLLSVHEAPNGFRWQIVPERFDSAKFEPGMITTNEPGIYLENKYGIRIENEMLCVEKDTNEFGTFYGFETITYAPIDLDAIKASLLTKDEKDWLNSYHQMVYEKISPYLTFEEKEWLADATRKI